VKWNKWDVMEIKNLINQTNYLVYKERTDVYCIAKYSWISTFGGIWVIDEGRLEGVTHWMELPEKPKNDQIICYLCGQIVSCLSRYPHDKYHGDCRDEFIWRLATYTDAGEDQIKIMKHNAKYAKSLSKEK